MRYYALKGSREESRNFEEVGRPGKDSQELVHRKREMKRFPWETGKDQGPLRAHGQDPCVCGGGGELYGDRDVNRVVWDLGEENGGYV